MGPIEALVLRAWGRGIRIDAGDKGEVGEHSAALVAILDEARVLDSRKVSDETTATCFGCEPTRAGTTLTPFVTPPTCDTCGQSCVNGHWINAKGLCQGRDATTETKGTAR